MSTVLATGARDMDGPPQSRSDATHPGRSAQITLRVTLLLLRVAIVTIARGVVIRASPAAPRAVRRLTKTWRHEPRDDAAIYAGAGEARARACETRDSKTKRLESGKTAEPRAAVSDSLTLS